MQAAKIKLRTNPAFPLTLFVLVFCEVGEYFIKNERETV
jgi:hypothetical protein